MYHEIQVVSNFVTSLSQEIGMKLGARTALDLFLGYISQAYCHYYILPENRIDGIQNVLEVLSKAAIYYQSKHNRIPVLFIDGVDILAKHDKKLCEALITLTKYWLMEIYSNWFW